MREFKFRIWDKQNKCFYSSQNPYPEDYPHDESRFLVTEFTGLTDRNGRKIFEGDIVAINSENSSVKLPVKFGRYSFEKFIGECGEISDGTELYGFYVENEYLYIQMLKGNVFVTGSIFDEN